MPMRGARGGGGFSPRGVAETNQRHAAGRRGRDLVEHDTVQREPLRGDTIVTPEKASAAEDALRRPHPGVASGVHTHRDDRDDRGAGQTRSAAGDSPDDGDASSPTPRPRSNPVALEGAM